MWRGQEIDGAPSQRCSAVECDIASLDQLDGLVNIRHNLLRLGRAETVGKHADRFLLGNTVAELFEHLVDDALVGEQVVERRDVDEVPVQVELPDPGHKLLCLLGVIALAVGKTIPFGF